MDCHSEKVRGCGHFCRRHTQGSWLLSSFTGLLPTGPLEQELAETRNSGHSHSQALCQDQQEIEAHCPSVKGQFQRE